MTSPEPTTTTIRLDSRAVIIRRADGSYWYKAHPADASRRIISMTAHGLQQPPEEYFRPMLAARQGEIEWWATKQIEIHTIAVELPEETDHVQP